MNSSQQTETLLLTWKAQVVQYFPNILSATLILLLFWLLASFSRRLAHHMKQRLKRNSELAYWAGWALYVFFMMSGVFLALDALHLTSFLTHLLAGAGIVGIVAGLALKDVASNTFSGLLVRSQRPFAVGDWVEVNNAFGQVLALGSLTTTIQTITGQIVNVPNQLIYSNNFTNYSTLGKWRVVVQCGVSYGDDLQHVRAVALDEMSKVPNLVEGDPIDFYFTEIGPSTYNFEVRYWVHFQHHEQFLAAGSEGIMRLKARFEQENISVAYNVLSLDFGVKGGVNLQQTQVPVVVSDGMKP